MASATARDGTGETTCWALISPADLKGSGPSGEPLVRAMLFKPRIKARLFHETWQVSPKTVCSEDSLTPSVLLFNMYEFWNVSSQVIYLKGTFVTCTKNCHSSLNIHLLLLFIILIVSWAQGYREHSQPLSHPVVFMCPCFQLNLRSSDMDMYAFWSLPWQAEMTLPLPLPPSCWIKQNQQQTEVSLIHCPIWLSFIY